MESEKIVNAYLANEYLCNTWGVQNVDNRHNESILAKRIRGKSRGRETNKKPVILAGKGTESKDSTHYH
jgi:hypothetical protein